MVDINKTKYIIKDQEEELEKESNYDQEMLTNFKNLVKHAFFYVIFFIAVIIIFTHLDIFFKVFK